MLAGEQDRFQRVRYRNQGASRTGSRLRQSLTDRQPSGVVQVAMWRVATQEVLFARPLQEADAVGFMNDEWSWFPLTVAVRLPPHVLRAVFGSASH